MKIDSNWATLAVLSLPFAWLIAFLIYFRAMMLFVPAFVFPLFAGFILGLLVGGFVADRIRQRTFLLLTSEGLICLLGIGLILVPGFWFSLLGYLLLFLLLFFFGFGLLMMTLFLNQFSSSIRRGHLAGIVTALTLVIGGVFSIIWLPFFTPIPAIITALLIMFGLIVNFFVRPWRKELQTYVVPGSILPYTAWWLLYLAAFGLYVWATPYESRYVFASLFNFVPGSINGELVLLGLGGAIFAFTFLPDKLGRKRVFSIASLLLGLLCIFGPSLGDPTYHDPISYMLLVLEVFVIGFIIGVGGWLVWAEVGPVRLKGLRSAFGWSMVAVLAALIWIITTSFTVAVNALIVFPISASLVLLSLFPLTNAREVLWNERIVEDIDIHVDTRQVSRALRELEVDSSLKSIEEQIETELTQLTKIRGISRNQAKELRDAGYETPDLVARADAGSIAQILSITPSKASQIIANAKKIQPKKPKSRISKQTRQQSGQKAKKKGKFRKSK